MRMRTRVLTGPEGAPNAYEAPGHRQENQLNDSSPRRENGEKKKTAKALADGQMG